MHLSNYGSQQLKAALATLAIGAATIGGFAPQPARADSAAVTRNIILGVAAAAAADIIYNNIKHKAAARNTPIGQTRNGGTVYPDGRVVYPNGDVLYTSNGNGQPCSYQSAYNRCINPAVYYPRTYAGQSHGNSVDRDDRRNAHAQNKHRDNDNNQNRDDKGHGHDRSD